MSWIDWLIIFAFAISAAFGIWRGFAKEALSLATWLAAIWLAWRFAWTVEPMLGDWQSAPELRIWASRAIIFLIVMVAGGVVGWLVRELIRHTGLSGTDRLLGGIFGLARGVLVFGIGVILLQLSGLDNDPWWQDSILKPYGDQIAIGIRRYAEIGGQYLQQQEIV